MEPGVNATLWTILSFRSSRRWFKARGTCVRISTINVPPNATSNPAYFGCGNSSSQNVRIGISVGWGDVYTPELAFQAIDASGLPAGAYKICATVNPSGLWNEKGSHSANNSYWMEVTLDAANNDVSVTGSGDTPC